MKRRFDERSTGSLLRFQWWDLEGEALVSVLPLLCDPDLEKVRQSLEHLLAKE